MPFSVWARGDSSTANNASLNAEGTSTTPTTLLRFEAVGPDGDEKLEFNKGAGTIDDDTVVYIGTDPTPYHFIMEFGGYLPQSNKLSNVNGVDLRGAEIVVLTIQETGQWYFFLVGSDGSMTYFNIMNAFPNGAHAITGIYACYSAGTLIDTPEGAVPIETISAGDMVRTADGRSVPVRLVVARSFSSSELRMFEPLRPVLIPAGSLGFGAPSKNLVISALHRILVRDPDLEVLFGFEAAYVMARDLPQASVAPQGTLTYVHLLCDTHECLVANGCESESLFPGDVALAALGPGDRERVLDIIGNREVRTAFPCLTAREAALWRETLVRREKRIA